MLRQTVKAVSQGASHTSKARLLRFALVQSRGLSGLHNAQNISIDPESLANLSSVSQDGLTGIGILEDRVFQNQVDILKKWWQSPRYDGIKRPYSAEDVASKMGSMQTMYQSSVMAEKLFNLLNEKAATNEPLHIRTYSLASDGAIKTKTNAIVGAIDPVQMTQQAAHQEALYVSGWACSSTLTTTNEVSPDFGDYPYNTVPNQVQRIFKAQQLHDRKHWDGRRAMSKQERDKTPYLDYLRPIIADGDTGYSAVP